MLNTSVKETKEQRFKRIASRRTEKVLEGLRKLGNCSNRGTYNYTNDDIAKIFSAIDAELKRIKLLFGTKEKSSKFTL